MDDKFINNTKICQQITKFPTITQNKIIQLEISKTYGQIADWKTIIVKHWKVISETTSKFYLYQLLIKLVISFPPIQRSELHFSILMISDTMPAYCQEIFLINLVVQYYSETSRSDLNGKLIFKKTLNFKKYYRLQ